MATQRRVTIYDVARFSRVSPATVSRSLSQPDKVHPRTLETVLDAVKQLGYRRGAFARPAGARQTGTIAMVVPDITNPYYSEAIRGAEKRAQAAGSGILIVNTEEDSDKERESVERLIGRVDGFVLTSSRLTIDEIRTLADRTQVVLLNRHVEGISSALVDQDVGSQSIIEHLQRLGHVELAFASGPANSWVRHQRWESLSEHSSRAGLRIVQLGPYRPSLEDGALAARDVLRTGATAVIAHNDLLALGILGYLQSEGIRVPEDLSVVGFDDMIAARICTPALTTLGGQYERAAHHGVEMLVEGRRAQHVVLPSRLQIRDSTGAVPQTASALTR